MKTCNVVPVWSMRAVGSKKYSLHILHHGYSKIANSDYKTLLKQRSNDISNKKFPAQDFGRKKKTSLCKDILDTIAIYTI